MVLQRLSRGNLQFLMGVSLGLTLSLLLTSLQQITRASTRAVVLKPLVSASLPNRVTQAPDGQVQAIKLDVDLSHHDDDASRAKELYKSIRVLVWVMTGPQNLDKRAIHVRNTWGKRANKLLFMSSVQNDSFPTIGLKVEEGRKHLTAKTMKAFQYVYQHHFHDADWFMKADDDTYVIMENLRYMLSAFNTQEPVYFGKIFRTLVKQGYASGGAGYVLSKEALRRLVTRGTNSTLCRQDGGAEDASIGRCLSKLGVKLLQSTDRLGRSRFHCFGPEAQLQGGFPKWFLKYDVHGGRNGMDSISDYPISFHYIKPNSMYVMDYFIYHLRPYGILSGTQDLNRHHPDNATSSS